MRVLRLLASFTILLGCRADTSTAAPAFPSLPPVAEKACDALPEAATAVAQEVELGAEAMTARYPYAPSTGLEALDRFAFAEQCYRQGLDDRSADRVAGRAAAFRPRIERDYRYHLLSYKRALDTNRPAQAGEAIEFLLALLAKHESAFTTALRRKRLELSTD